MILSSEELRPKLHRINFKNVTVQAAPHEKPLKAAPVWPSPASRPTSKFPFFRSPHYPAASSCVLDVGISFEDLIKFFDSGNSILCRDPTGHDFPSTTLDALTMSETVDLSAFDRLVIYTDGSSFAQHRHRSVLWNDDEGYPDIWAFVVLGENYHPSGSQVQVLGWLTHPVHYRADSDYYAGAQHIGSYIAEREAMLWAGLWRLSQNVQIDTVFRTDSSSTAAQASGDMGSAIVDESFMVFRGVFQALESALPGEALCIEHIPLGIVMSPSMTWSIGWPKWSASRASTARDNDCL